MKDCRQKMLYKERMHPQKAQEQKALNTEDGRLKLIYVVETERIIE